MSAAGEGAFPTRGAQRFGEVLAKVIKAKRFYEKGKYGKLVQAWQAAVGEEIAGQTRIRSYAHGRLVIDVSSPMLLHELAGFMKAMLLEKLRGTPGGEDVAALRFRLSSAPLE